MKSKEEIYCKHTGNYLRTEWSIKVFAAMEEYASQFKSPLQQEEQEKWISVEERLPENNDEILIYSTTLESVTGRKLRPYACFYHDGFVVYGFGDSQAWLDSITVTHWQPLPNPPKK